MSQNTYRPDAIAKLNTKKDKPRLIAKLQKDKPRLIAKLQKDKPRLIAKLQKDKPRPIAILNSSCSESDPRLRYILVQRQTKRLDPRLNFHTWKTRTT
ncbi:hypothetical protein ACOMHN_027290 [Nucella lapillus]